MAPDEAARILAIASAEPPTSVPLANLLKIIRDEAHLGVIGDETTLKATTAHVPNGSSAVAMEGFRAVAAVLVAQKPHRNKSPQRIPSVLNTSTFS